MRRLIFLKYFLLVIMALHVGRPVITSLFAPHLISSQHKVHHKARPSIHPTHILSDGGWNMTGNKQLTFPPRLLKPYFITSYLLIASVILLMFNVWPVITPPVTDRRKKTISQRFTFLLICQFII